MKFQALENRTNCSCCKKPYTEVALTFVGIQRATNRDKDLALFNCTCGSTICGENLETEEEKQAYNQRKGA